MPSTSYLASRTWGWTQRIVPAALSPCFSRRITSKSHVYSLLCDLEAVIGERSNMKRTLLAERIYNHHRDQSVTAHQEV
ncbi:hypothetical protein GJ744_000332 [Endocarpon pusillum]|uniref:Uncharacterized protein n=1 Tax=Endocarpon pusillum TaxID=364733 RepID=A0A8H7AX79_9EURO|nr:hypothetical protein GJ744_000332 [Endocarpon pusillum]